MTPHPSHLCKKKQQAKRFLCRVFTILPRRATAYVAARNIFHRPAAFCDPRLFGSEGGGRCVVYDHRRNGARGNLRAVSVCGGPPANGAGTKKGGPSRDRPYVFVAMMPGAQAALGSAAFACAMIAANTPPSFIARSAMTLRSRSTPASFTPCMNCE